MNYLIEKIEENQVEVIHKCAMHNAKISKLLLSRGGYLKNNTDLNWAVDNDINSHIYIGPQFDLRPKGHVYFFYYKEKYYTLKLSATPQWTLTVEGLKDKDILPPLKSAVKEAFRVHRYYGLGDEQEKVLDPMIKGV